MFSGVFRERRSELSVAVDVRQVAIELCVEITVCRSDIPCISGLKLEFKFNTKHFKHNSVSYHGDCVGKAYWNHELLYHQMGALSVPWSNLTREVEAIASATRYQCDCCRWRLGCKCCAGDCLENGQRRHERGYALAVLGFAGA